MDVATVERPEIDLSEYIPLVISIACKFGRARGPIRDSDEFSDGLLGLFVALRYYNPAKGTKFSTFASTCVRHAVIRGVYSRHGYPGSYRRAFRVTPFSQLQAGPGDECVREEDLVSTALVPDRIEARDMRALAVSAMRTLDPRMRRIVKRHLFQGKTLAAIAQEQEPPVTKEAIRQRVKRAYRKMREYLERQA